MISFMSNSASLQLGNNKFQNYVTYSLSCARSGLDSLVALYLPIVFHSVNCASPASSGWGARRYVLASEAKPRLANGQAERQHAGPDGSIKAEGAGLQGSDSA